MAAIAREDVAISRENVMTFSAGTGSSDTVLLLYPSLLWECPPQHVRTSFFIGVSQTMCKNPIQSLGLLVLTIYHLASHYREGFGLFYTHAT